MRSAALPSQSSGSSPAGHRPVATSRQALKMASGSTPTMRLVPRVTVMGRSVVSRRVRQGTRKAVVSSWMPPESVRTQRAPAMSWTKSR